MNDQVRVTVNIGPETRGALGRYRKRKNVTTTEAIRHAVARLDFTEGLQERGACLLVREQDGTITEVRFIS